MSSTPDAPRLMGFALVFLGGGIGAALRHGVNRLALATLGPAVPAGTVIVNIAGSFAMGLLVGALAAFPGLVSPQMRLFLATGVLGGFTTFSAFSLDALALYERGQPGLAALYVGASVALSLAAVAAGVALARG
jgi:CrcB protein